METPCRVTVAAHVGTRQRWWSNDTCGRYQDRKRRRATSAEKGTSDIATYVLGEHNHTATDHRGWYNTTSWKLSNVDTPIQTTTRGWRSIPLSAMGCQIPPMLDRVSSYPHLRHRGLQQYPGEADYDPNISSSVGLTYAQVAERGITTSHRRPCSRGKIMAEATTRLGDRQSTGVSGHRRQLWKIIFYIWLCNLV